MPPSLPTPALLFDVDGCLLDTEPLYTRATEEVLAELGHTFEWSLKQRMMGQGALPAARLVVAELGLPFGAEEYLRRTEGALRRLFAEAPAMPGAEALVRRHRHLPLAVCTSSRQDLYRLKTARHPWFSLFSVVVTGDDPALRRHKPAPDPYLLTAERLGVAPADCIVFEDSPQGVRAALDAGMRVIALPDPRVEPALLEGAQVARDWEEAERLLATLLGPAADAAHGDPLA